MHYFFKKIFKNFLRQTPPPTLSPLFEISGFAIVGEHCELPQQGLERSHSQNRIWCILALKYGI